MDICPLEIPNEDPLDIRPVVDAVKRKKFEPCSNMVPQVDGEVLNDEMVIIHSSSSVGESEVFEPYIKIRLLGIFGELVGGRKRYGNGAL